jgi:MFS family permease
MVIVTIGMGSGQFLLNLHSPSEIDLFILISVIISLGLIPILLTAKPAPLFKSTAKMSIVELYRASPLAVIGNCLTGMAHGTIFGLGAIYATAVLVDLQKISWFMACFLIGALISLWPIGYLSDRLGRRLIMAALSIVAIVCCVIAVYITKDSLALYLVIVGLGSAAMPMYSICIAYANDRLEPHQIIAASGSLVMTSSIGLCIGPIVIAFLMDYFGLVFYFWGIAAVFGLILMFTLIRMTSRPGIAVAEQSQLIAGTIGTPIAEYASPDAVDYAEAVASDNFETLAKSDVEHDKVL